MAMVRSIYVLLFIGCQLLNTVFGQSIDFSEGIVAYFPFNGNAMDMTNQGNDGFVNGATLTQDRFGQENSAYYFDGNKQSIRIPYSSEFDFSDRRVFSVSVWIQPQDLNPGCILLKSFDFGVKWNRINAPLTIHSGLRGGYPSTNWDDWNSKDWYHLVLVQEEDNLSLYVNGVLDVTLDVVHETKSENQDLFLGGHPYFWGGFKGKIDDLVMYNRPLNDFEIQALNQIETMPLEITPRPKGVEIDPNVVKGVWQGLLTQPANQQIGNYAFWIRFIVDGERVTGHTRIEVQESNAFGIAAIQGEIVGDRLNFREVRIISQKNFNGFEWCQKLGRLSISPENDELRGNWFADNCQKGGEIILYPTKNSFNYYDNRLSEKVALGDLLEGIRGGEVLTENQEPIRLDVEPIEFITNSARITQESQFYLEENLLPLLKEIPDFNLTISGHTDSTGEPAYNLWLSKERAKAVLDLLVKQGISADKLISEGYGEGNPIANNETPEGRKSNRRVEFEITLP